MNDSIYIHTHSTPVLSSVWDWTYSKTALDYRPAYDLQRSSLSPYISDRLLTLIAPVLMYWLASAFFHLIDIAPLPFLDKYRIHEPEEMSRRNKVSRTEVIRAVLQQQLGQTILGLAVLESDAQAHAQVFRDDLSALKSLAGPVRWTANLILGPRVGSSFVYAYGHQATELLYWWAIPIAQYALAFIVMDTWQYWLHRWAHTNKWLYKHVHSVHHRLYVPYSYGALYNSFIEGFFLDSVGAALSQFVAGMSIRQSLFLFAFATLKTVNDHATHRLPFNPLNVFPNDAVYHNYHHQMEYIKYNYSQPFFVHMDWLFGTMLTPSILRQKQQRKLKSL